MSYPHQPHDPNDPHARRRRRDRRRRDDSRSDNVDDALDLAGSCNPSTACRSCGKPLRGCDGCDLFHLSVLRVFLLSAPVSAPRAGPSVAGRAGVAAIRGYQRWLSHRMPTCCPHTPTCSHYGAAVVRRYGLLQGARLALGRIARCTGDVPRGTPDLPP